METPVFRLEGVVKTKNETSDFEGPLALILQLLSKNKIEIRDISISLILEQYRAFLDEMAWLDLDIASEFVAMAAHLAYIKSKMMLARGEEVSELEQLITSLEELSRGDVYAQIKSIAQALSGMYIRDGLSMAGPPEYMAADGEYRYVHSSEDLIKALCLVIGRENALLGSINQREATFPQRVVFSIPDKILEVIDRLKRSGSIPVTLLLHESSSRAELIATLIAVLELCRVGSVLLTGGQEDITITYTGVGREAEGGQWRAASGEPKVDWTAGD